MKILWINGGLHPKAARAIGAQEGVTCGWLESMLDGLKEIDRECEYCVLCLDYRKFDVFVDGVRYISFGERGKAYYNKIPKKIQQRVKYFISEVDPDVIHVQGTEYYYGCFDADVYCSKPVVVSLQGLLNGCHVHYTGGLSPKEVWWTKFNLRLLRYGSTLFRDQTFWREKRSVQEERIIQQHRFFIGRTEWDKAWVHYFNPNAVYFYVNETLRRPFFLIRRSPQGVRKHSIYCSAAAGYPLKGVHWLMRAIASLKPLFPDIQLRIVASADGLSSKRSLIARLKDCSYHAYLRRLMKYLGIEDNVVALPPLSADKVADELKMAELFVLPSLCENSPNSLGEAMLVGTPCIATFVGGIPSILKDGVEGRLVPSGDPAALASAIRHWFLHPEEAEACVESARETALARHDAKKNAEDTMKVYRSVIGNV